MKIPNHLKVKPLQEETFPMLFKMVNIEKAKETLNSVESKKELIDESEEALNQRVKSLQENIK